MPEPYFERPNWPRLEETPMGDRGPDEWVDISEPNAHDMAALEAVDRLKVKKDEDFARKITANVPPPDPVIPPPPPTRIPFAETPDDGRRRVSERLRHWWHQS